MRRETGRKPSRHRRIWAVAVAAIAVALIAGGTVAWDKLNRSQPSLPSRDATLAHFLGRSVGSSVRWEAESEFGTVTWRAVVPGVGVFSTDSAGSTILIAVLSHKLGLQGRRLDDAVLLNRARSYAL